MISILKFEIAKLLKEKGFDLPARYYYEEALTTQIDSETKETSGAFGWEKGEVNLNVGVFQNNNTMTDFSGNHWYMCAAPSIAEVVMWLYETHGIWINVYRYKDHAADVNDDYMFRSNYTKLREFKTPEEAYEAAIIYTLNNLIEKINTKI